MFLSEQFILITGASGRIGSSIALDVAKYGGIPIIADVNLLGLEKLKEQILKKYKVESFIVEGNITTQAGIENILKKSISFNGLIHGAVQSAYPRSKGWGTKFEYIKEDYLKEDLSNQLGSTILFSQQILKIFKKQGFGNLINISSIQGINAPKFEHYSGTEMISPIEYSAIKAGVISLTKWLAKYYFNNNIRINCISPGGILDKQPTSFLNKYRESCSNIGMLNSNEHISPVVIFLLSELSIAITGQNIIIDDGWSL